MDLFTPIQLGPYLLPNRIVLAPLTRNRAAAGNVPTALNATYYAQRATAGLLITEASQVSPQGIGYPATPGIHSQEQVRGWRLQYGSVKGERERGKGIKNSFTLYPLPFPHSPNSKLKMLNRTVLMAAGD
jgi:2,4-dienoyl-CoA reductase-like NADH-dependent reductase (Old Yellow Enzyme family)